MLVMSSQTGTGKPQGAAFPSYDRRCWDGWVQAQTQNDERFTCYVGLTCVCSNIWFIVFLGLAVCRKSEEPMEPADGGDMNYPTQEYVLPEPELECLGWTARYLYCSNPWILRKKSFLKSFLDFPNHSEQLGSRLPMSPADGYCTAGGSSCYAETFKDPASPAFSYHPDNQLGLEDTPDLCFNLVHWFSNSCYPNPTSHHLFTKDPHAVTPDGNTNAGHEGSPTSAVS